jgi:hypothetical protein
MNYDVKVWSSEEDIKNGRMNVDINLGNIKFSKFRFCDDLGTPELGVVLDHKWAQENWEEIRSCQGVRFFGDVAAGAVFMIPEEEDRLYFILRWS